MHTCVYVYEFVHPLVHTCTRVLYCVYVRAFVRERVYTLTGLLAQKLRVDYGFAHSVSCWSGKDARAPLSCLRIEVGSSWVRVGEAWLGKVTAVVLDFVHGWRGCSGRV